LFPCQSYAIIGLCCGRKERQLAIYCLGLLTAAVVWGAVDYGQITNRIMNEVGNIGSFFARLFLQPAIHTVMVIFYGLYLFELNWKLAIAGTVFIPF